MIKIGIFGLPNSGKSQFRRWLVNRLRGVGIKAEHWDADRFKKARVPEDADMREPAEEPKTVWLIEDVRGTVPHKEAVAPGEKEGAWKPLPYYDFIFYLIPDWTTYAMFWVSRALQWQKAGAGNWMRESGWEDMADEEVIVRKVQHFLEGRESWVKADEIALLCRSPRNLCTFIRPVYRDGRIEWRDFEFSLLVAVLQGHV